MAIETPVVRAEITRVLWECASVSGGWPYYEGKLSRLEPTCWAMFALGSSAAGDVHRRYVLSRQRPDGLFSDGQGLPANLTLTALALLATSAFSLVRTDAGASLVKAIVGASGLQLPNSPVFKQNNQLKGWSWVPDTFSWVEPTSWCLLALKRVARSEPVFKKQTAARVDEGEQVLFDRACESGGWNFGNANAFGTNLPAHIPTSAIGMLALRDKPDHPVVQKSLAFVEQHWRQELSGTALALSTICLKIYGRPTLELEDALVKQWDRTRFLGNLSAMAMACLALSDDHSILDPLKLS